MFQENIVTVWRPKAEIEVRLKTWWEKWKDFKDEKGNQLMSSDALDAYEKALDRIEACLYLLLRCV